MYFKEMLGDQGDKLSGRFYFKLLFLFSSSKQHISFSVTEKRNWKKITIIIWDTETFIQNLGKNFFPGNFIFIAESLAGFYELIG